MSPIAINGSGTITGISAGGLPDDCITTAEIAANAVTTAKLGSAEASGLCKAWVNFNGTGTVAIRASYNVSSITDNGSGDYTVNFTTAMVDANYSVVANGSPAFGVADFTSIGLFSTNTASEVTPTVSAARIVARATSVTDLKYVCVAVFR
jgi:hypothetical protein